MRSAIGGQHQRRRGELTGCGCKRRESHALEPPAEYPSECIDERGREADKLRQDVDPEIVQGGGPDHQDRSGKADQNAGELGARRMFVTRADMRDHHPEERRRRVQDRGEAARDMGLAPREQRERDDVVQEGHAEQGAPDPRLPRQRHRNEAEHDIEDHGRDRDAQEHQCQRRQFVQDDAIEEEGPAPQHREGEEHRPFGAGHAAMDRRHAALPSGVGP
jgi:hypothetical protein